MTTRRNRTWGGICGLLLCAVAAQSNGADLGPAILAVRSVGAAGSGNPEAAAAMHLLSAADPAEIPTLLKGMANASPLAANWLRSAVESAADRALASGGALPLDALGGLLLDTSNDPRARRLAHELIARVDPSTAKALLAGMVNDPAPELRRDAVQLLLDRAAAILADGSKAGAALLYQQALALARSVDQIDGAAKKLRELGHPVDLRKTFGFLTEWKIIGPFDNVGGKGFAAVYPPEGVIDMTGEYEGKAGAVRWRDFTSDDEYGLNSLNKPYTSLKGVVGYAHTEFFSDSDRAVELRLGSQNAFKIWLNGQYLFGQEEYHRGKAIDQYRMPAQLKKGKNTLLVKVCQNELMEDWAGDWDFQLRICDPLGAPIHSANPNPRQAAAHGHFEARR